MKDKPGKSTNKRSAATNQEIQKWVARRHGFIPETMWIEHCKHLFGIAGTSNIDAHLATPCPPERQTAIKQAFQYFHMLP
jgi:hypothetical protein